MTNFVLIIKKLVVKIEKIKIKKPFYQSFQWKVLNDRGKICVYEETSTKQWIISFNKEKN